jgi:diguanylate cyclase (GGDEF)-like protein
MKMVKGKILIVDNEKENINKLSDILSKDCEIIVAESITASLEISVSEQPDLILLGMNDPQMIQRLKNSKALKDVPIIFVLADDDALQEEKSLTLGAADFIALPPSRIVVKTRVNTQLKIVRQKKMIEMLAMLDSLTEIPDKASFQNRFTEEWHRAARTTTPLTLAKLEIDFFKQFAENKGNEQGDEALKIIASTIVNSLKRASDFTARIGDSEFALIIPENSAEGAYMLLDNIARAIRKLNIPNEYSAPEKFLTVSVGGITCLPFKGFMTPQEFMKQSSILLKKAKLNRTNNIEWADNSIEE